MRVKKPKDSGIDRRMDTLVNGHVTVVSGP